MFLEVKGLIKIYDKKEVLNNIDFNLEKGEILCILGPSGCGKTTILNSIGGFVKIDFGDIILDNKNITKLSPEKREISTVFQSYGLFNHKNVFENVEYGLKFKKINKSERKEKVFEVLKILELKGYENRKISELSGGQQQRVALARSIVINPRLILMDEPFSNLDENLKDAMRKELKRLVNYFKMTAIVVTHDQEDAFSIADKVILMNNGKIVQCDTPINLYNNPNSEFATNFIGKTNILEDRFYKKELKSENIDNEFIYNSQKIKNIINKKRFIRPEKVKLYNYDENNKELLKGKIREILFKGSIIEYTVEIDNGLGLSVFELNRGNQRNINDIVLVEI